MTLYHKSACFYCHNTLVAYQRKCSVPGFCCRNDVTIPYYIRFLIDKVSYLEITATKQVVLTKYCVWQCKLDIFIVSFSQAVFWKVSHVKRLIVFHTCNIHFDKFDSNLCTAEWLYKTGAEELDIHLYSKLVANKPCFTPHTVLGFRRRSHQAHNWD